MDIDRYETKDGQIQIDGRYIYRYNSIYIYAQINEKTDWQIDSLTGCNIDRLEDWIEDRFERQIQVDINIKNSATYIK